MAEDGPVLYHPKPRRPYDLTPTSTNSSAPSLSRHDSDDSSRTEPESFAEKANRTRSILNLTSSTLFGIYTPGASSFETKESQPVTPSGTGSQTPGAGAVDDSRPPVIGPYVTVPPRTTDIHPHPDHAGLWGKLVLLSERIILLFFCGMAYGVVITHLRDTEQVVPVRVDLKGIEHNSWGYLLGWGGIGVLLGALLPWVDILWEEVLGNTKDIFPFTGPPQRPASPENRGNQEKRSALRSSSGLGADWNPAVRSIGAFIGIAFAIVRLPFGMSIGYRTQLTYLTAQSALEIHLSDLTHPCPRQSRPLVPRRPLKARLFTFHNHRPRRYSHRAWRQPRHSTSASYTIASCQLNVERLV